MKKVKHNGQSLIKLEIGDRYIDAADRVCTVKSVSRSGSGKTRQTEKQDLINFVCIETGKLFVQFISGAIKLFIAAVILAYIMYAIDNPRAFKHEIINPIVSVVVSHGNKIP